MPSLWLVRGGVVLCPNKKIQIENFQTLELIHISCVMLYEPKSSNNKDKEGDNLSDNFITNLKGLTTNIEIFLVF